MPTAAPVVPVSSARAARSVSSFGARASTFAFRVGSAARGTNGNCEGVDRAEVDALTSDMTDGAGAGGRQLDMSAATRLRTLLAVAPTSACPVPLPLIRMRLD